MRIFLILFLVISSSIRAASGDPDLFIYHTSKAPVIDGKVDQVWKNLMLKDHNGTDNVISFQNQEHLVSLSPESYGQTPSTTAGAGSIGLWAASDGNHLYFLFLIDQSTLTEPVNHPAWHHNVIDFWLDGYILWDGRKKFQGPPFISGDGVHMMIGAHPRNNYFVLDRVSMRNVEWQNGVRIAKGRLDDGKYVVEMKVPSITGRPTHNISWGYNLWPEGVGANNEIPYGLPAIRWVKRFVEDNLEFDPTTGPHGWGTLWYISSDVCPKGCPEPEPPAGANCPKAEDRVAGGFDVAPSGEYYAKLLYGKDAGGTAVYKGKYEVHLGAVGEEGLLDALQTVSGQDDNQAQARLHLFSDWLVYHSGKKLDFFLKDAGSWKSAAANGSCAIPMTYFTTGINGAKAPDYPKKAGDLDLGRQVSASGCLDFSEAMEVARGGDFLAAFNKQKGVLYVFARNGGFKPTATAFDLASSGASIDQVAVGPDYIAVVSFNSAKTERRLDVLHFDGLKLRRAPRKIIPNFESQLSASARYLLLKQKASTTTFTLFPIVQPRKELGEPKSLPFTPPAAQFAEFNAKPFADFLVLERIEDSDAARGKAQGPVIALHHGEADFPHLRQTEVFYVGRGRLDNISGQFQIGGAPLVGLQNQGGKFLGTLASSTAKRVTTNHYLYLESFSGEGIPQFHGSLVTPPTDYAHYSARFGAEGILLTALQDAASGHKFAGRMQVYPAERAPFGSKSFEAPSQYSLKLNGPESQFEKGTFKTKKLAFEGKTYKNIGTGLPNVERFAVRDADPQGKFQEGHTQAFFLNDGSLESQVPDSTLTHADDPYHGRIRWEQYLPDGLKVNLPGGRLKVHSLGFNRYSHGYQEPLLFAAKSSLEEIHFWMDHYQKVKSYSFKAHPTWPSPTVEATRQGTKFHLRFTTFAVQRNAAFPDRAAPCQEAHFILPVTPTTNSLIESGHLANIKAYLAVDAGRLQATSSKIFKYDEEGLLTRVYEWFPEKTGLHPLPTLNCDESKGKWELSQEVVSREKTNTVAPISSEEPSELRHRDLEELRLYDAERGTRIVQATNCASTRCAFFSGEERSILESNAMGGRGAFSGNGISLSTTAHTGKRAVLMSENGSLSTKLRLGASPLFAKRRKPLLISFWALCPPNGPLEPDGSTAPRVRVETRRNEEGYSRSFLITTYAGFPSFKNSINKNEWRKFELLLDSLTLFQEDGFKDGRDEVEITFLPPQKPNGPTYAVLLDDIRIAPVDSRIQTLNYHHSGLVSASLDERNEVSFPVYDLWGGLIGLKDDKGKAYRASGRHQAWEFWQPRPLDVNIPGPQP